jgi:hypothetical protein
MTQHYIGRKIVMAWEQELDGQAGYQVKYSNGHISWSPKDAFDESHLPLGHVGQYNYNQQLVMADLVEFKERLKAMAGVPGELAEIERGILRLYIDVTQKKIDEFAFVEHEVASDVSA